VKVPNEASFSLAILRNEKTGSLLVALTKKVKESGSLPFCVGDYQKIFRNVFAPVRFLTPFSLCSAERICEGQWVKKTV